MKRRRPTRNHPVFMGCLIPIIASFIFLTSDGFAQDCGDFFCDGGEDCMTCELDCGPCCGDGFCDPPFGEDCMSCEPDCGMCCGDFFCDEGMGEDCMTCELDCGECCGDGTCDEGMGEDCVTCELDCGPCSFCGDTFCDPGEDCLSCPPDCPASVVVDNLRFTSATDFGWDPSVCALATYDVIQGDMAQLNDAGAMTDLGTVVCVENDSADTVSGDAAGPPAGEAWFYLVRPFGGNYGTSSDGDSRMPAVDDCL